MTARVCRIVAAAVLLCVTLCVSACSVVALSTATSSRAASTLSTYADYEELTRALGFDMVQIAGGGYEAVSYDTIDGRIGQIIYQKDDVELNLRMMRGTGDISGVNCTDYSDKNVYGVEVHFGSFANIQAAWFEIGDYTYAMSATEMTEQLFEGVVTQIVDQLAPR